jgi:hypothetical protein
MTADNRLGDFTLPMRGMVLPDTAELNDTLRVSFAVGDNYDVCSYFGAVWVKFYDVTYITAWGVNHPGTTCRETTVAFQPAPTVSHPELYTSFRREPFLTSRAVFCQPDGSFIVKTIVIRVWVQPEDRRTPKPDSVQKLDSEWCHRMTGTTGQSSTRK